MKNITITYPNFSQKAISFTLDDGNLEWDKVVIEIMRPHGVIGTFNLTMPKYDQLSKEGYRELYSGYGIANHCAMHPYAFLDGVDYKVTDEPFDKEKGDPELIYKSPDDDRLYYIMKTRGWRLITTPEHYIELVEEAETALEELFGVKIKGFVWPFGEQSSEVVHEYLKGRFESVRRTGAILNKDGFDAPQEYFGWSYNATHTNLLEVAEMYEAEPDNGNLKLFTFGVHSVDYPRAGKLDTLKEFAEKYGDRKAEFWYATIDDIFDYLKASRAILITDDYIVNTSDEVIYLKRTDNGQIIVLPQGAKLTNQNEEEYYV